MTIDTIFFDAGLTLLTEHRSRAALYAEAFSRHGRPISEAAMAAVLGTVHRDLPRRIAGAFRYTDTWFRALMREVARRVALHGATRRLESEIFAVFSNPATFRLYDDVHPALGALRDRGIRLGLISNWGPRLRPVLGGHGLDRLLDDLLISAEVECEKPQAAIFWLACRRLGTRPDRALHVGDNFRTDHAGASGAGLASLLLDRRGPISRSEMTIRTLTAILDHV